MTFKSGTVIFALPYGWTHEEEEAIDIAKKYIVSNGYTNETVRIYKSEGLICVAIK